MLACLAAAVAGAEEPAAPASSETPPAFDVCKERITVTCFSAEIDFSFALCRQKVELFLLSGEKIPPCVGDYRASSKPEFSRLLAALKSKQAKDMLKDFYSLYLASLSGLLPKADERKFEYKARNDAAESKMNQMAERLGLEE
jgi:hypothetical protein